MTSQWPVVIKGQFLIFPLPLSKNGQNFNMAIKKNWCLDHINFKNSLNYGLKVLMLSQGGFSDATV